MSFWTGVVLGAVVGWLAEWIIDWIYWRRRRQLILGVADEQVAGVRGELATAQRELADCRATGLRLQGDLQTATSLASQRAAELDALQGSVATLRGELASANKLAAERDVALGKLRAKLDAGGVRLGATAAEPATETMGFAGAAEVALRAEHDRLRAEIDDLRQAATESESQIARLRADLVASSALVGERDAEIARLRAVAPTTALLGAGAGAVTARLDRDTTVGRDDEYRSELLSLRHELAHERRARELLRGSMRDPLIDIDGIGPVYERRLQRAGIYTFAELVAASPERLREIVNPEPWQKVEPEKWIAEAHGLMRRGAPDVLAEIDGVDEVNQQRLHAAGIYSYEQLAALSPDQLREVVGPAMLQSDTAQRWIGEASLRAGRSRPDRLAEIDGIGEAYQRRLQEAGIYSFQQLASRSPEELHAIVQPRAGEPVNTGRWIVQARNLMRRFQPDALVDINGIGPVYERRLADAGVYTFEMLAALTPDEIRAIIRPQEWQLIEAEKWIAEARSFAEQQREAAR